MSQSRVAVGEIAERGAVEDNRGDDFDAELPELRRDRLGDGLPIGGMLKVTSSAIFQRGELTARTHRCEAVFCAAAGRHAPRIIVRRAQRKTPADEAGARS
jgi:hypothetical protein